MTDYDNLSTNQKIRASLHKDAQSICFETCHLQGFEITKPAMEVIAELVYKRLTVYGMDLEAFAKHAKRQTINSDDVKLLARRNTSLTKHLTKLAGTGTAPSKERRRKTFALPATKQPDSPAKKRAVTSPTVQRNNSQTSVHDLVDLT